MRSLTNPAVGATATSVGPIQTSAAAAHANTMALSRAMAAGGRAGPMEEVAGAQDTIYLCNFRVSVDGEWLCLKELQDMDVQDASGVVSGSNGHGQGAGEAGGHRAISHQQHAAAQIADEGGHMYNYGITGGGGGEDVGETKRIDSWSHYCTFRVCWYTFSTKVCACVCVFCPCPLLLCSLCVARVCSIWLSFTNLPRSGRHSGCAWCTT